MLHKRWLRWKAYFFSDLGRRGANAGESKIRERPSACTTRAPLNRYDLASLTNPVDTTKQRRCETALPIYREVYGTELEVASITNNNVRRWWPATRPSTLRHRSHDRNSGDTHDDLFPLNSLAMIASSRPFGHRPQKSG
jgi:hypothetical protein